MRRTLFALPLVVFTLVALSSAPLGAQSKKLPSGTMTGKVQRTTGLVSSVTTTSLTVSGSAGGGATSSRTYAIDSDTKVIAKGGGTAAAASGGKVLITDIVAAGDRVSVSYRLMGDMLHATEVRVTAKNPK